MTIIKKIGFTVGCLTTAFLVACAADTLDFGNTNRIQHIDASYEYAPDITFLNDTDWIIYYCGLNETGDRDAIYRIDTFDGGGSWSDAIKVFHNDVKTEDEGLHTCDPTVVRHNDVWHMFYDSEHSGNEGDVNERNRIFHATSMDGLTWDREGMVVDMINVESNSYGAGMPSVLWDFKRQTWTMYYTDVSGIHGNTVWRIDSLDKANLDEWDVNTRVKVVMPEEDGSKLSWDVAYFPEQGDGTYLATAGHNGSSAELISVYRSDNGIDFTFLADVPSNEGVNHNSGILRNDMGHAASPFAIYWGAGDGGGENAGSLTWDLWSNKWILWGKAK